MSTTHVGASMNAAWFTVAEDVRLTRFLSSAEAIHPGVAAAVAAEAAYRDAALCAAGSDGVWSKLMERLCHARARRLELLESLAPLNLRPTLRRRRDVELRRADHYHQCHQTWLQESTCD